MRHILRLLSGMGSTGILWGVLSCTPRPSPTVEQGPPADDCALLPGPAEVGGAVVIALTDEVDPARAPMPRNASERLLFAHFYETLLRIDCRGRVMPGLADRWEPQDDWRQWRLTLRRGARFWDGTRVTAADVVSGWRLAERESSAGIVYPWIDAAIAFDDSTVVVSGNEPRGRVPEELAYPAYAVTKPPDVSGWRLGTGAHRPDGPYIRAGARGGGQGSSPPPAVISAYPVGSRSWTLLQFRLAANSDPRDLLDDGVDLLIADGSVREYSATLPNYVSVPLLWDKTYVLLSPSSAAVAGFAAALPPEARNALARDVVSPDARGTEPSSWWYGELRECGFVLADAPLLGARPAPRIAYLRSDVHARALAERLVAVGGSLGALGAEPGAAAWANSRRAADTRAPAVGGERGKPDSSLRGVGLDPVPFESALRAGNEVAYVLAVRILGAPSCSDMRTLLERAPWLAWRQSERPFTPPPPIAAEAGAVEDVPAFGEHILPLVETRPWLIARAGLAGIQGARDGTPCLDGIGWRQRGSAP